MFSYRWRHIVLWWKKEELLIVFILLLCQNYKFVALCEMMLLAIELSVVQSKNLNDILIKKIIKKIMGLLLWSPLASYG